MNNIMKEFKNIFKGQTVWIIGAGPSLQYLTKEDIKSGPIITLDRAIIKAEEIGLSGSVFSMQKDGGPRRRYPTPKLIPDCDHSPNCGDVCGPMYRPKQGATLLVHRHESLYCFPDYSPRYVFDWKEFGLPINLFSLILAIKIGTLMGCDKFRFISCDAHAIGCFERYVPNVGIMGIDPHYKNQPRRIRPYLADLDYEWITPVKK